MTDTRDSEHVAALEQERDVFRNVLVQNGFIDDGDKLQGIVPWTDTHQALHTASVEVTITERFPFAPPGVKLLEAEAGFTPTFHIEKDGRLCLWTNDVPVHDAPWRDPEKFIEKVSGWFALTHLGWPEDSDVDLERYLDIDKQKIILYDKTAQEDDTYYHTSDNGHGVVEVKEKLRWSPNTSRMKNRGVRRRERKLIRVVDVGEISGPIKTWQDLRRESGQDCNVMQRLIEIGSLDYLLIRYKHNGREGVLALSFPGLALDRMPALRACESADKSVSTRMLRAGNAAQKYAEKKVAIIGCGAIGSHVADLLFRSGVHRLTLIDPERLRPGNVIRHAADNKFVGRFKTSAVGAKLASIGLDVSEITFLNEWIVAPDQALELVRNYDVVVDATADARVTALMCWAAKELDGSVVSACVQRSGAIARVDRFPPWDDERYLDAVPSVSIEDELVFEQGCGSPVSTTPPLSVVKAASIACQVVLDELNKMQSLPATILEVVEAQSDVPYNNIGIITSK